MKPILFIYLFLLSNAYAGTFNNLREFKEQNFLTDIILVSRELEEFPCHKLILSAYSIYFKNLLTNSMKESFQDKIHLNLSSQSIKIILDNIYNTNITTITFTLSSKVYFELLDFSNYAFAENMKTALNKAKVEINISDDTIEKALLYKDINMLDQVLSLSKKHLSSIVDITHDSLNTPFFSPDKKKLAIILNRKVKVYDTLNGKLIFSLAIHDDTCQHKASFSHDGRLIVTTERDDSKIWDAIDGKLISTIDSGVHNSDIFIPNSTKIITSYSNKIKAWDTINGRLLFIIDKLHDLSSVSTNHDGSRILTLFTNHTAKIWDIIDNKLILKVNSRLTQFNHSGNRIITVFHDGLSSIWDTLDGKLMFTLNELPARIHFVKFSPDDKLIVTISGRAAKIWDAISGKPMFKTFIWEIKSASFSNNSKLIITISYNSTINILDTTNGQIIFTTTGHPHIYEDSFFISDNKFITMTHNIVQIWDALTSKLITTLNNFYNSTKSVSLIPNSNSLIVSNTNSTSLYVLPPNELLIPPQDLLQDDNAALWLKLRHGLALYMENMPNKNLSYKDFLYYIKDKDLIDFIEQLNKTNDVWVKFAKHIFDDIFL